jgi:Ca2+-binding RTX toxin-like protein
VDDRKIGWSGPVLPDSVHYWPHGTRSPGINARTRRQNKTKAPQSGSNFKITTDDFIGAFLKNLASGPEGVPANAIVLDDGRVAVFWQVEDVAGGAMRHRLYDLEGIALSDELVTTAPLSEGPDKVVVTAVAQGGFLALWQTPDSGVSYQNFDLSGNPFEPVPAINPETGEFQDPVGIYWTDWQAEVFYAFSLNLNGSSVSVGGTEDAQVYVWNSNYLNRTFGSSGNDTFGGSDSDDMLAGLGGNDSLSGGTGEDYLFGGSGRDLLDGGAGVDQLSGGAGDDYLFGGSGDDVLDGGTGHDVLDGGAGADQLSGGAGDDNYILSGGDFVSEAAGGGIDTVISFSSAALGVNLENLVMTGSAAINGTGNTLNNVITGNAAANSLSGGLGNDTLDGGAGNDSLNGGSGIDRLTGGNGNDTYTIETVGDLVVETNAVAATGGTDTVLSSLAAFTLTTNVENLTLTGSAAINGTGNRLNNVITGNAAANSLSGGLGNDTLIGGAGHDTLVGNGGADTLTGGAGSDRFNFNSRIEGVDRITDFNVADDTIVVSAAGFGSGLVEGAAIAATQFRIGLAANSASQRFIYNATTGGLFFDPDGNGKTAQTQLAILTTGLAVTNADIFVAV